MHGVKLAYRRVPGLRQPHLGAGSFPRMAGSCFKKYQSHAAARRFSDDKDGVVEALRELLQEQGLQASRAEVVFGLRLPPPPPPPPPPLLHHRPCCCSCCCCRCPLQMMLCGRAVDCIVCRACPNRRSGFAPLHVGGVPSCASFVQCHLHSWLHLSCLLRLQDLPLYVGGVSRARHSAPCTH